MPVRGKRIMLVDDSSTARTVLADQLADLGYEADGFASAEDALQQRPWTRFDAFIVDMRLPGLSGLEFLAVLKQTLPQAIVVLVTQYESTQLDGAVEAYENVWFLRKPTDPQTLGLVLKNAFEASELRRDVDRLSSLSVGIKSVGRVKDLDQEFRVLLHLASDSLSADAGAVFMLAGPERSRIEFRCGVGTMARPGPEPIPAGGLLSRCIERQEPVLAENVRASKAPDLAVLFPEVLRLHVLAIPLVVGQRLVGVMAMFRDPEREVFSPKDMALAKVYAATTAIALENLSLLEQARDAFHRQVEAQRELIQSRKLSSLGQVTAGIAHEIRNPLTVILGNVDLIRKRAGGPELDPYLDRIRDQCTRVHKLITDLKAVYHPGGGARSRFPVQRLMDEALSLAPPPATGLPIDVELAPGSADQVLEADFGQMLQVVINLMSNSYQAMEGKAGRIELALASEEDDLVLVYRDTGPGVPREIRRRIFEPFFTTKGERGTGLGMWISETILRSHGGSIELVDHPEGGACFHLRLPRPLAEAAAGPHLSLIPGRAPARTTPLARILVIDDDREVRAYLVELLQSEGFASREASGPTEAEALLLTERFDAIVLDERLQGASGREFFLRVIRPRFPIPTLYFTGDPDGAGPGTERAGFAGILAKPASGEAIVQALRRALIQELHPGELEKA